MAVSVEYTATGISLAQYAAKVSDLGPVLNATGAYIERLSKEAIIRGQTIGGKPLAPLAPSTVAEKQYRKKARGILRRDGGLLASLAFARTSATEVQVGTNLEYAPWVILGTQPYAIRPQSAARLRFYGQDGWRSAKQVNHPGLPERNIFDGFQDKAIPFFVDAFGKYLES